MKSIVLILFCYVYQIAAQPYNSSIEIIQNWSGWEGIIIKNGLITTTTVPAIGARVMQFDLGEHQSIFRDKSLNGKTFTPGGSSFYNNFGGFKNWPAPQYGKTGFNWPPPPTLDYGLYDFEIIANTTDSVTIKVTSPIEKWKTPDLQFIRIMTVYKNSSRVRMEQILLNHGTAPQVRSIWDVTQSMADLSGKNDYENHWFYFPIHPDSKFGEEGDSSRYPNSPAWVGEIVPGIFGSKFTPNADKLFADPDKGWICYVDELDSVLYAKSFKVFEGAEYPDNGTRIALYMAPDYTEVEVTGPMDTIPALGGQISFTIDWWAAKVKGPILEVNSAGAVNSFMKIKNDKLTGNYGVFHTGTAKLVYLDNNNQVLGTGPDFTVTPLQNFNLSEALTLPVNVERVELHIYTKDGRLAGVLDNQPIDKLTEIEEKPAAQVKQFLLEQNYPNPFNPATVISYVIGTSQLSVNSHVTLKVYDVLGNEVATLVNTRQAAGEYEVRFSPDEFGLTSGVYFYRLEAGDFVQSRKMMYIK